MLGSANVILHRVCDDRHHTTLSSSLSSFTLHSEIRSYWVLAPFAVGAHRSGGSAKRGGFNVGSNSTLPYPRTVVAHVPPTHQPNTSAGLLPWYAAPFRIYCLGASWQIPSPDHIAVLEPWAMYRNLTYLHTYIPTYTSFHPRD